MIIVVGSFSVGCKNTEQSIHPLNVGFYRSGEPKTTTQTALDQIPRTGPPIERYEINRLDNLGVIICIIL